MGLQLEQCEMVFYEILIVSYRNDQVLEVHAAVKGSRQRTPGCDTNTQNNSSNPMKNDGKTETRNVSTQRFLNEPSSNQKDPNTLLTSRNDFHLCSPPMHSLHSSLFFQQRAQHLSGEDSASKLWVSFALHDTHVTQMQDVWQHFMFFLGRPQRLLSTSSEMPAKALASK